MTSTPETFATRPPGRPRNSRADEAILAATEELVLQVGYDGLTVEAVANLAGVGRPTVYRRWPDKAHLCLGALSKNRLRHRRIVSGTLAGDLEAIHRWQERLFRTPLFEQIVPFLLARLAADAPLRERYEEDFVEPRRSEVADAMQRAVGRGEIRAVGDADDIFDLLTGPLFYRVLVAGRRAGAPLRRQVVQSVLAALGASR
jgi:AcrR family transcriptional regulator